MDSATNSSSVASLRYVSYNMHGFKSNRHYLQSLLDVNDIICVQEHWLPSCDLHRLHSLHSDFVAYGRSSMDDKYEHGVLRGRPFGGVAAFVRKSFNNVVSFCSSSDDGRIICLKVTTSSINMLLFACYFPVCDNSTQYVNSLTRLLGFIDSIINTNPGYKICVLGDLNFECNDNNPGYVLYKQFSDGYNLVSCDNLVDNDAFLLTIMPR